MTTPLSECNPCLTYFQELLPCIGNLYYWHYQKDWSLIHTNCPDTSLFENYFFHSRFHERVSTYALAYSAPYAISAYNGLVWYAVIEKEETTLISYHLLGPVLYAATGNQALEKFLREYENKGMNIQAKRLYTRTMQTLPVLTQKQFGQMALMLHYSVNHEYLPYSFLNSMIDNWLEENTDTAPVLYREIHNNLQGISDSIRTGIRLSQTEGNQTYYAMLPTNAAGIHTPLRQLKDTLIILTSHFADAAIQGGVSAETAYALADQYFHSAESDRSATELLALCKSVYTDFLNLVQESQTSKYHYSKDIDTCINYIYRHIEEDLSLPTLAALIGYTPYYLSRKFLKKTGTSLPVFIRSARIRSATVLLKNTNEDITQIAARLHFSSPGYFASVFHEIMGLSPSEYRKTAE